ncbi:dTMP kinase [Candidatus Wolfebacteria bacterium]|nr:dTMP kinase [Candidatus Wolfebacteria bacterium]
MSFIVFEGGEGAGKSTCIHRLRELLPKDTFVFTREPGGSTHAEQVRNIVVGSPFTVLEQLLFMEVSRAIHLRETIKPALEAGLHVVCDRFSASTFAYQITADHQGKDLEDLFHTLEEEIVGGTRPNLWVDFVVDPSEGMARKQRSGDALNIFDKHKLDYHIRVRKGLDMYLADKPVKRVDASRPPEELAQNVLALIQREIQ